MIKNKKRPKLPIQEFKDAKCLRGSTLIAANKHDRFFIRLENIKRFRFSYLFTYLTAKGKLSVKQKRRYLSLRFYFTPL